jgi:hypothetical protein
MRNLSSLILSLILCSSGSAAKSAEKHYLYMSTPDAAQKGGSGTGILVYDIEDGHRFVRRIDIPSFKEGLRGFCASAKQHAAYFSTTSARLGCFDLETEKILWDRKYEAGCDRACVTLDGSKLYVPTGWWWSAPNSGFLVVDAQTGDLLKKIPVGPQAHNSIASLDGQFIFLGTQTNLTVSRARDDSVVWRFTDVGESGVFPFTVDSRNRFAFICLYRHVGFDVADLQTGKVLHRVFAGEQPITHRTHGAALTPDETELWISDQEGKKLFYFDATQMPPKQKGFVDLTAGGHGWVAFSLDGRFAWCHTPDVIDVRTKKIVATLKDENGQPTEGSKFIEVHFRDGKVLRVGDQFGLGRAHLKPHSS